MQIRYNAIRNGFWSGFNMKIEPRHDKTKKKKKRSVRPAKTQISLGIRPVWSVQRCPPEAKLGPKLPTERTAKTLIRLGTKVILMVLSWGDSKCFFLESTYAAHIHFITFRIEPNMKSFSHTNNIVLRQDICIHSLNWCKLIKLFSLANGTWCAVTVPSFDFVKDDCAVGSAVLGTVGYDCSSIQSMVLLHVKPTEKKVLWADRKHSNGFFDGVRNDAGCIYYSRKRVSDNCIFNFWCLMLTQKSSHTS